MYLYRYRQGSVVGLQMPTALARILNQLAQKLKMVFLLKFWSRFTFVLLGQLLYIQRRILIGFGGTHSPRPPHSEIKPRHSDSSSNRYNQFWTIHICIFSIDGEVVGVDLDGSSPSLPVVGGREASAGATKLD